MKRTDKVRFQCTRCKNTYKRQIAIRLAGKVIPCQCKQCGFMESYRIPEYRKPKKGGPPTTPLPLETTGPIPPTPYDVNEEESVPTTPQVET